MLQIVVAYARRRVIGQHGRLPWHLPADLRHFRTLTIGHTVVMGRRTFDSIGRPLPGRVNVVLTRQQGWQPAGVEVVHQPADVLARADLQPLFIIGGESVYRLFLPCVQRLYLTEIDADFAGDAFFPEWDRQAFHLVWEKPGTVDAANPWPHRFLLYERTAVGTRCLAGDFASGGNDRSSAHHLRSRPR
ncbi:MAG: dihydrofolate reductase [Alicyclobacillus sp.]|nr:dihydrofolate reductase [Alicyclobacillus sp.]